MKIIKPETCSTEEYTNRMANTEEEIFRAILGKDLVESINSGMDLSSLGIDVEKISHEKEDLIFPIGSVLISLHKELIGVVYPVKLGKVSHESNKAHVDIHLKYWSKREQLIRQ